MANSNPADWLDLLESPLEVEDAVAFVASPNAGGIDIFLGTTRSETSADGRKLVALDYQAYDSMVRRQFVELSQQSRRQWPITRLVILHRTGRVLVGQPSVLIAVSTPHRAQAFEACRWIIDQLKKEVTIWKQEVWEDGTATWVHVENSKNETRSLE
jgi:molybdopterin synthase catalytic subunit